MRVQLNIACRDSSRLDVRGTPLIPPTALLAFHHHQSDSLYELNILKVNSRGAHRIHTRPHVNVQNLILFLSLLPSFIFPYSLTFSTPILMPWLEVSNF